MTIASTTWLSPSEAARRANRSKDTVRRWIDAGLLPSFRTSLGHRYVDPVALEHLIAEQETRLDGLPQGLRRMTLTSPSAEQVECALLGDYKPVTPVTRLTVTAPEPLT